MLHALGGQGKSQIALEFCRRSKKTFRGIFWINASSRTTAEQGFDVIATRFNTAATRMFDGIASKIEFVKDSLENWDERWMLVFDN